MKKKKLCAAMMSALIAIVLAVQLSSPAFLHTPLGTEAE